MKTTLGWATPSPNNHPDGYGNGSNQSGFWGRPAGWVTPAGDFHAGQIVSYHGFNGYVTLHWQIDAFSIFEYEIYDPTSHTWGKFARCIKD